MLKRILFTLFLLVNLTVQAQDSLNIVVKDSSRLKVKNFIIPAVLMTSGLVFRDVDLKRRTYEFHQNALGNRYQFKQDDFLQYLPVLLDVSGEKLGFQARHGFMQRGTNQLVSLSISGIIGRVIKMGFNDKRPELYGLRSFPSGHTNTAFNSATLLFLEYKDDNIWFASSGFVIATATGFFRVTNEKHWVADVLFGAGLGMSTAFVVHYWSPDIYKFVKKHFFKKSDDISLLPYPVISRNNFGIGLLMNLK